MHPVMASHAPGPRNMAVGRICSPQVRPVVSEDRRIPQRDRVSSFYYSIKPDTLAVSPHSPVSTAIISLLLLLSQCTTAPSLSFYNSDVAPVVKCVGTRQSAPRLFCPARTSGTFLFVRPTESPSLSLCEITVSVPHFSSARNFRVQIPHTRTCSSTRHLLNQLFPERTTVYETSQDGPQSTL